MKQDDSIQNSKFQKFGLLLAAAFFVLSVIMVIRNHGGMSVVFSPDTKVITFAHWQLEDGFREGFDAAIKIYEKEKAEQELEYLEQMEDDLRKCTDARGLSELREMLVASGHVRQPSSRVKPRKEAPSQPMKFRSCDGIEMEVGKNALQNERLTMGARGNETWLHAQKMPGSHVLIHTEGDVPESTLMQAAMLAAYYSKGVRSAQVPIDATLRRYIKKPGGTPAGFVTYTHQRTLYITPSEAEIKKIELLRE